MHMEHVFPHDMTQVLGTGSRQCRLDFHLDINFTYDAVVHSTILYSTSFQQQEGKKSEAAQVPHNQISPRDNMQAHPSTPSPHFR